MQLSINLISSRTFSKLESQVRSPWAFCHVDAMAHSAHTKITSLSLGLWTKLVFD